MPRRDLDVVVFGATGVTGRGVAAYLDARAAEGAGSWAAAGRDEGKLERVLAEVGVTGAETILADLAHPQSLAAMCARAKVVLDLVGPYALYGRPVIEACIAEGAHYVDLSGEIPFVKEISRELGPAAESAGVKIVQVCGFESLPPDLAIAMAAEAARERWGEDLASVDLELDATFPSRLVKPSDVLSGGTIQSIAGIADHPDAPAAVDPAALVADAAFAREVRDRSPIRVGPRLNGRGGVLGPMTPAAFINPAVIHRTAELTGAEHPFRFREGLLIPGPAAAIPLRYAAAGAMGASQAGIGAIAASRRTGLRRRFAGAMRKALPDSGYGPSGESLERWRWTLRVDAVTTNGNQVRVDVDAHGHPGYLATSRIVGEAGLLLAEKGATPDVAGALTPAVALGTASAPRFSRADVTFSETRPVEER